MGRRSASPVCAVAIASRSKYARRVLGYWMYQKHFLLKIIDFESTLPSSLLLLLRFYTFSGNSRVQALWQFNFLATSKIRLIYFESIAPAFAGIKAPGGGAFFFLKSSQTCSIVTNSTPSCFLKCSMSLQFVSHISVRHSTLVNHTFRAWEAHGAFPKHPDG